LNPKATGLYIILFPNHLIKQKPKSGVNISASLEENTAPSYRQLAESVGRQFPAIRTQGALLCNQFFKIKCVKTLRVSKQSFVVHTSLQYFLLPDLPAQFPKLHSPHADE